MEHEIPKTEESHDLHKNCCHEAKTEPLTETQIARENKVDQQPSQNSSRFLGICIIIGAVIIGGAWVYTAQLKNITPETANAKTIAELEKVVLPVKGVALPVKWGDLGKQMIDAGVIDRQKFESLYSQRGGMDEGSKNLLYGDNSGQLVITKENSGVVLNLLWALGLGNKNGILEIGPMMNKQYGGADKFASTGGWTLASGKPMDHYSRHTFVQLTLEQQALVEKVSQNIYRPCCGNSTYFPDCNHGMAMLGLLELMASQGVNENDMYKAALAVNSYWFPDTYVNIAQYLKSKGISWKDASPKDILGIKYSSAQGYQAILKEVQPAPKSGGGSCGA